MPLDAVTRRGFFANLLTAGVGGVARVVTATAPALPPPQRAWVISEVGWEYNAEFTYAEGAFPRTQLSVAECLSELPLRPWMAGSRKILAASPSLHSLPITPEPLGDPDD